MKSQNLKKLFVIAIAISCFVSVVGFTSASNMDDARNIAISNLNIFVGSADCIVVGEGNYYNDSYIFPVEDINTHKTIGNISVNGKNGTCTPDFLTKDDARSKIATYLKNNFPNNGYGFVPQTPIYISNVHYGVYGFKVPVVNFNKCSSHYPKLFNLYVDKDGIITD